jgi:hypothetical protein
MKDRLSLGGVCAEYDRGTMLKTSVTRGFVLAKRSAAYSASLRSESADKRRHRSFSAGRNFRPERRVPIGKPVPVSLLSRRQLRLTMPYLIQSELRLSQQQRMQDGKGLRTFGHKTLDISTEDRDWMNSSISRSSRESQRAIFEKVARTLEISKI